MLSRKPHLMSHSAACDREVQVWPPSIHGWILAIPQQHAWGWYCFGDLENTLTASLETDNALAILKIPESRVWEWVMLW